MNHTTVKKMSLLLLTAPLLLLLAACGSHSSRDVDACLSDAEQLLAEGNPDGAARICATLMAEDFDRLDENQLGRMAIVFMKLPDTDKTDENIADATQCVRQAWKLSGDSLRGFISTLAPEDVPHFVMLTRISGSIDFPPDLSEEGMPDDSIHSTLQP
jgi:hypothetical protein